MKRGVVVFHCAAFLCLLLASAHANAQLSSVQACSKAGQPGGGQGGVGALPNPNLDFHATCERGSITSYQGQICIFMPTIQNAALSADVKYLDWSWGTVPAVTWRRYQLEEVRYTYPVADAQYLVELKATFHSGQVETVRKYVSVDVAAETAHFGYNNVFYGLSLHLESGSSGDPTTHRWYWDFGDGTIGRNESWKCLCKTYDKPGQYKVKLTVSNETTGGSTVSETRLIDVRNLPPDARFAMTNTGARTYSFDASASTDEPPFDPSASDRWLGSTCPPCNSLRSNADIRKFEWDFGDGSFGEGMNVTHEFTRPGTHTVRLTASDRAGAIGMFEQTVTIPNEPPEARLDFSCVDRTCSFDATRSLDDGGVRRYTFDFGDGSAPVTTVDGVATRTYASDRQYTVRVTANDGSLEASASRVANVNAAYKSPSLYHFAVEPCRVLDTQSAGSPLTSGTPRTIAIAGNCNVPTTARAVALQLTVVAPNAPGHIAAYRAGESAPSVGAVVFGADTAPRTNSVVIPLSGNSIAVMPTLFPPAGVTGTAHLQVDVAGFYSQDIVPFAAARGPFFFQPLTPCRAMDSRQGGTALTANTVSRVMVRGRCGIPANLGGSDGAAAINLTVVQPSAGGSVSIFPSDMSTPPATNAATFPQPVNQSGGVQTILAQRANDDIGLLYRSTVSGATAHYTVDVTGYYADGARHTFHPLRPCRLADTRRPEHGEPRLAANVPQDFQVRGNCGVPLHASAAVVSATAVNPDAAGYLVLWPAGTAETLWAALNFSAGERAVGTTTIVPLGTAARDLSARAAAGTDIVLDVFGYFTPYFTTTTTAAADEEGR